MSIVRRLLPAFLALFLSSTASAERSVSGQPYLVRCGDAAPVESKAWLEAELRILRGSRSDLDPAKRPDHASSLLAGRMAAAGPVGPGGARHGHRA